LLIRPDSYRDHRPLIITFVFLLHLMNFAAAKKFILVIIFYSLPVFVFAQQLTVNGVLYKKDGSERIAQATVTNLNNQVIMMSDELGGFTIKAAKGDTLLFKRNGYTDQKQSINGPDDIAVFMAPVVALPQVNIKSKSTQQELNDVMTDYRSKGLYFDGRPPIWSFLNSPLTGLYELFGQDAANERRFARFSKNEMEAVTVDKRYTRELVKRVTDLPDEDVIKFMQQYIPSYEDMKSWNDYELISHVKKFLIYYKKNKKAIKIQQLY
jgi:hypothetical protein